MNDQTWTERSADKVPANSGIIKLLKYMAENSGTPGRLDPPLGGKLIVTNKNATLYTGGDDGAFDKIT